ncbi:hypothetical protein Pcinc_040108 [Petrolisthes cinctipes]|uniref:4-coumarate--CoA ligase n=1 Tax=Petrolisthes cinctipes TaxID=88211 RepID=A0AAE1EJW1_PETCI|nr:hypothetical protein Pcinc_040108 [Petrolisthes cinctipes]
MTSLVPLGLRRSLGVTRFGSLFTKYHPFQQSHLLSPSNHITTHSEEQNVLCGPPPISAMPQEDLHHLIFSRAAKWSHMDCFECSVSGKKYTYGEVMDRALRWGGILSRVAASSSRDVKKVGFFCTNAPEFPIILLGSLAYGSCFVTFSSNYTVDEVARQITDSEVDVFVTDSGLEKVLEDALNKTGKKLPVFVNGNSAYGHPNLCQLIEDPARPFIDPVKVPVESAATILYSSGTTGKPKGVVMSHKAFTANLASFTHPDFYDIPPYSDGQQDVVLGVLPFYHIYGLYVTSLLNLYNGVKIVSFPSFQPEDFLRVLRDQQVRVLHLVPPMLNFLVKSPIVTSRDLASVEGVMVAAAPVPISSAKRFKEKAPKKVKFQEGFGMTETLGTHMTPLNDERLGYCGKTVVGVKAKVVNEAGEALPEGERGELCLKTPSLMTSYYNNPETTKDSIDGDGWFHTGDVAIHQDGFFSIVDRIKELIKVKGLQVSPSELEDLLLKHPGVGEVGVVGVADERSGELPRAYVVKKDKSTTEEDLHQFLSSKVSGYKQLKGGIRFMDGLPKNATGKLLRKDLKEIAAKDP